MRVETTEHAVKVIREPGDPKISGGPRNAAGESRLLYRVKAILNERGWDLIKKRMYRDGHMVDDMQQYLRSRNVKGERVVGIWNGAWAIEGADEKFNRDGAVTLRLATL